MCASVDSQLYPFAISTENNPPHKRGKVGSQFLTRGFNAFVDAAQNSICNSMSSVHSYEQQKQRADQPAQINMAKVRFFFTTHSSIQ